MVVIKWRTYRIRRDGGKTRSDFKLIVVINQRYVDWLMVSAWQV
ncbi:hypothetical protein [Mycolicibacterium sp. P9-22]|nr:hypothetical protein [Mycolicibacterium sp. P9-22]